MTVIMNIFAMLCWFMIFGAVLFGTFHINQVVVTGISGFICRLIFIPAVAVLGSAFGYAFISGTLNLLNTLF